MLLPLLFCFSGWRGLFVLFARFCRDVLVAAALFVSQDPRHRFNRIRQSYIIGNAPYLLVHVNVYKEVLCRYFYHCSHVPPVGSFKSILYLTQILQKSTCVLS